MENDSDEEDAEKPKPTIVPGGAKSPQVQQRPTVDAGFWLSTFGGAISLVIVVVCALAMFLEWWTKHETRSDGQLETTVTLWEETTVFTAQIEEAMHEGCLNACDRTRVVKNKVATERTSWEEICRPAEGELLQTCNKIMVIRSGVALVCGLGFIYTAWTFVSFYGSGQRYQVFRFPSVVGVVISVFCFLVLLAALFVALAVGDSLGDLNGPGFWCLIVGFGLSLPSMCVAGMAKKITEEQTQVLPEEKLPARTEPVKAEDHAALAIDRHTTSRLQASAYAWGITKDNGTTSPVAGSGGTPLASSRPATSHRGSSRGVDGAVGP